MGHIGKNDHFHTKVAHINYICLNKHAKIAYFIADIEVGIFYRYS